MRVTLENVGVAYEGAPDERTVALDAVSLELSGGVCGLMGRTGSGKTTLLEVMAGATAPDAGVVRLVGQGEVGLVFQLPERQFFEPTVERELTFGLLARGVGAGEARGRAGRALALMGLSLDDLARRSPFSLSGGQQRRVAIASVLALRPALLLLDEPTAGLDPAGRDEILSLVKRYLDQSGATVLIVSHSMEDIARLANRLLVMNHAKILFCDTPREVFSHAEEIVAAGLDIPMITKVMLELKKRGHAVDTSVFTVAQALEALRACKRKEAAH